MTRVEIEEDGLPAQLAPRIRRPGRDEPAEPWSPNYGNGGRSPLPPVTPAEAFEQSRRKQAAKEAAKAPAPVPARLTGVDEDTLVRRAIAEHEMRRRD